MALPHPLAAGAESFEARANSTNSTAAVTVRLDRQQDVSGAIEVVLHTATGERRWRVPDTRTIVRVELPDGDVRLRCAGRSVWCPEMTIPRPAPVEVQLPVLPGARLRGRWAGLAHEDHIVEILGAWRSPRPSTTTSPLRFVERVSVDPDGQFSVDVPAGVLDLKVNASGCAPVYRFALDSRRTGTLGDLRCVMGGSVAGRVRDTRTGLVIERARIVVRPASAQVSARTAGRHDPTVSPEFVTVTDQNGFFQVSALAPGRYRLTIEAPERAPTDTVVDVSAGTETYVDDLWVHPWRLLTIAVEPPQTPDHEPWMVSVRPRDPEARPDTPGVTEARTDEEGLARFDGLRAVEHEIEVRTLRGDTLYLRSHDLPDDDAPLTIAVPVVTIEGTVRRARQPVADAEVRVSSGSHDERSFVTDASGCFEGWMRQPDDVVYVDVVTGSPPVQRSLTVQPETVAATRLKLSIELGGGRLRVRTVLPDRQPVSGATVQVHQPGGSIEGMLAVTAQDGTVEFDGLDAGRYYVTATSREHGPSDRVEVDLTEVTVADVDLVLHGSRILTVHVEAFEGTPIAGAEVSLYTDDGFDRRVTDAAGYATLRVSRRSAQAVVRVAARSHMLWAGCVRVGPDDVMAVRLPATMPGTLRLEVATRRAPGRTLLLLTGDAGFHTLGALTSWRRALGLPMAPETTIEVPRVAPGLYRLAWAPGPETAGLVTAVCTGALSAIGGHELAPDRVLTLTAPRWR